MTKVYLWLAQTLLIACAPGGIIDSIATGTGLETSHVSIFLQYYTSVHSALKSLAHLSDDSFDLWLPVNLDKEGRSLKRHLDRTPTFLRCKFSISSLPRVS